MKPIFTFFVFLFLFSISTNFILCNASLQSKKEAYSIISIKLTAHTNFHVSSPNATVNFCNTFDKPIDSLTVYKNPSVTTKLISNKQGNHTVYFNSSKERIKAYVYFKYPLKYRNEISQKDIELIALFVILIAGGYYIVKKGYY